MLDSLKMSKFSKWRTLWLNSSCASKQILVPLLYKQIDEYKRVRRVRDFFHSLNTLNSLWVLKHSLHIKTCYIVFDILYHIMCTFVSLNFSQNVWEIHDLIMI